MKKIITMILVVMVSIMLSGCNAGKEKLSPELTNANIIIRDIYGAPVTEGDTYNGAIKAINALVYEVGKAGDVYNDDTSVNSLSSYPDDGDWLVYEVAKNSFDITISCVDPEESGTTSFSFNVKIKPGDNGLYAYTIEGKDLISKGIVHLMNEAKETTANTAVANSGSSSYGRKKTMSEADNIYEYAFQYDNADDFGSALAHEMFDPLMSAYGEAVEEKLAEDAIATPTPTPEPEPEYEIDESEISDINGSYNIYGDEGGYASNAERDNLTSNYVFIETPKAVIRSNPDMDNSYIMYTYEQGRSLDYLGDSIDDGERTWYHVGYYTWEGKFVNYCEGWVTSNNCKAYF